MKTDILISGWRSRKIETNVMKIIKNTHKERERIPKRSKKNKTYETIIENIHQYTKSGKT